MVSKSESSLVLASTSHQDRVFRRDRQFLAVIYPAKPGEPIAEIERLDDSTVRIVKEIISFNSNSPHAQDANFVIDVSAMHTE